MAADVAQLLDAAERPRVNDWSLRAALTRYAQSRPHEVSSVLEQVRRLDAFLHPHAKALLAGEEPSDPKVAGALACLADLDELGDLLARWAGQPWGPPGEPVDEQVREVAASVADRLDALGVPHEERPGPPRRSAG